MASVPLQTSCPRRLIALRESPATRVRAADWVRGVASNHSVAWIGARIPPGIGGVHPAQAAHWLGRELDALVFETGSDLPGDALAIAAGLVRGGGVFLLLVGSLTPTPFSLRLKRFLNEDFVEWLDTDDPLPTPRPIRRTAKLRLNADQARIFQQLAEWPGQSHRSTVVVTAPRGRGKSTLLGELVGHWQTHSSDHLLVTAPNPAAIRPLLRRLDSKPGSSRSVKSPDVYVAPQELLAGHHVPDLLVVDEAAAMPVHRLLVLSELAPRSIFATTTAGFEGSGRGFSLRFLEALRQQGRRLRELQLEQPARWPRNDPLEDWITRLFLMDAEAQTKASRELPPVHMRWLSGKELARSDQRLAAVVGLLSHAHYRTRPSDLQRWLDGDGGFIGLLRAVSGGELLGVVLARTETGLDRVLARAVWSGERRPLGHFLPCVLAAHGAFAAAGWPALRVARIAVHPQWQRRGLGKRMLAAVLRLARREGFAMVGASFGARPDLLRFWNSAGFRTLRVGFRRETTSGLHAAVVVRGANPDAGAALDTLAARVAADWSVWCQGPLRELEPDTMAVVQQGLPRPHGCGARADMDSVRGFAESQRPFELALPALQRWLRAEPVVLQRLGERERLLLTAAVLELRGWPELCALSDESGRAGVIRSLRRAVRAIAHAGASSASQRA